MNRQIVFLKIPEDKNLLAAVGEVTVRQGHLDHILKMTVKTFLGLSPEEAEKRAGTKGSGALRGEIRKLAKEKIRDPAALDQISCLLDQAEKWTDLRNDVVHGVWAHELDGDPVLHRHTLHQPIPSAANLLRIANELAKVTSELNEARLEGFLATALSR